MQIINLQKSEIWWKEYSIGDPKFTYPPNNFHIGHKKCLKKWFPVSEPSENWEIKKVSLQLFPNEKSAELKKYWEDYKEHHYTKKSIEPQVTQKEFDFNQILKKAEMFTKKK
ncbi:MAG: hypothetical protein GY729_04160 [Desulfobacteraceae bacterium]|nr:hypothetical protein [Desulfobacteraceae bacterium]